MTTITPPTADTNLRLWRRSAELLYAGDIDRFADCWASDATYTVAYPVPGFPAAVAGRDALRELFAGFSALAASIAVEDVRFHQTVDPEVAFVEEQMVVTLHDGSRHENSMCIRVTFRDGLLAAMHEYYGELAHRALLTRAGLLAEVAETSR